MKLITFLFLGVIYAVGVQSAAVGYNYDKPEIAFDAVATRVGSDVEDNALEKDNAVDLRYQEEEHVAEEVPSQSEVVEQVEHEQIATPDEQPLQDVEQIAAAAEEVVQQAEESPAAVEPQGEVEQIAAAAEEVVHQAEESPAAVEPQGEVEQPSPSVAVEEAVAVEVAVQPEPEVPAPTVVQERISEESLSAIPEDHSKTGYDYKPPVKAFPPPLPEQLAVEATFMHQELGSQHKPHRHGAVKRLKLHKPKPAADCGGRDWLQVVMDRAQARPKERRQAPYTEENADISYFVQE